MNIFYLDPFPVYAAEAHGDRHLVKMIVEAAQMLSTAHHVLGPSPGTDLASIYKPTHVNHPMARWVRHNQATYDWTCRFLRAMCREFEFRRHRPHATSLKLAQLAYAPPALRADEWEWTDPPRCMPPEYQAAAYTVDAYRNYYVSKYDEGIVTYDWGRPMPYWLQGRLQAREVEGNEK